VITGSAEIVASAGTLKAPTSATQTAAASGDRNLERRELVRDKAMGAPPSFESPRAGLRHLAVRALK
jgi:hypothetical protein